MDQQKIGSFLRELRKEKKLTQEQLAEHFNVSDRSVSRWETGRNMPDLSVILELADFYDVDVREILIGERKSEMDQQLKDTLDSVADYTEMQKKEAVRAGKRKLGVFIAVVAGIILAVVIWYGRTMVSYREFRDKGPGKDAETDVFYGISKTVEEVTGHPSDASALGRLYYRTVSGLSWLNTIWNDVSAYADALSVHRLLWTDTSAGIIYQQENVLKLKYALERLAAYCNRTLYMPEAKRTVNSEILLQIGEIIGELETRLVESGLNPDAGGVKGRIRILQFLEKQDDLIGKLYEITESSSLYGEQ